MMNRKQELEIAYCEDCGRMTPWLTVFARKLRCLCGSRRISRGETGARGVVRHDER